MIRLYLLDKQSHGRMRTAQNLGQSHYGDRWLLKELETSSPQGV
jgi:hypothetical protein